MAQDTKIAWCDHTVNFWWGCTKVSPACANCYAERQDAHFHPGIPWKERFQGEKAGSSHWGPDAPRLLRVDAARREALRYERRAVAEGRRFRVFTNSMSDFFEDRRDLDGARLEALDVIRQTPHLDWLILTKRPEKIRELLTRAQNGIQADLLVGNRPGPRLMELRSWLYDWLDNGNAPANVWLGTTVEDQGRADQRIPALLQVPAAVRFLSCEPLLGPVDLRCVSPYHNPGGGRLGLDALAPGAMHLDWVICGGESGPHARPMHPDWARGLRDQCAAAGVPFLFKQWGEWFPMGAGGEWPGRNNWRVAGSFAHDPHQYIVKTGKHAAGRLLDGVEHLAFPEVGRV